MRLQRKADVKLLLRSAVTTGNVLVSSAAGAFAGLLGSKQPNRSARLTVADISGKVNNLKQQAAEQQSSSSSGLPSSRTTSTTEHSPRESVITDGAGAPV